MLNKGDSRLMMLISIMCFVLCGSILGLFFVRQIPWEPIEGPEIFGIDVMSIFGMDVAIAELAPGVTLLRVGYQGNRGVILEVSTSATTYWVMWFDASDRLPRITTGHSKSGLIAPLTLKLGNIE